MLVIDVSASLRTLVRELLDVDGIDVLEAGDAATALELMDREHPDGVVLDLALSNHDGFAVLERIRTTSDVPMLAMTGFDDEVVRVRAFDLGADQVITKPFSRREFPVRVRSLLRTRIRHRRSSVTRYGALSIDHARRTVTIRGRPVSLRQREFDLLAALASAPGHVLSRDQLLRDVWRSHPNWQSPATVTEHIRRLRQAIEPDPRRPRWIHTVRGGGYRFTP